MNPTTLLKPILLTFLCSLALTAQTQNSKLLPDHLNFDTQLNYDPAIPSPKKHLGYELGAEYTVYAHVVDYIKTLASLSNKILINQYGATYEGRPLYNLVISSEENIRKLETLRQDNLQLANPASISSAKAEGL